MQNDIEEALTILLAKNMKSDLVRDAAKALLVIDPTNEVATRKLMRHFAAIGEVAASIRAYDSLYRILEEEFDVEPVQETIELVAEIKLGQEIKDSSATGQEEVPQRIGLDRPTICIVPFQSSSAPSVSNISRSFFRDLLSILIRFREWNVIEGDQRNLHSDYYVLSGIEGTSENGRPILEILLKQAKTGKYLWSERREITHKSWSINHSLIARRVAVAINSNISTDRLVRRGDLTPHTQNAFDRWIHCQDLNAVWSPEAGLEIPKLLKAIIEDEPLFAPAHAELAANYNSRHIFFPGLRRRVDFREQALHHARIALEIDPLDTRSQRVMAWTHLMRNEHDHAEFHFRQALDLNATNPFTLVSSAQGLAFCGKIDHAFELIEDASRLQSAFPKFLNGYLVGINFLNGRYKESVVASRRAGNAISNLLGWEASALWHLGNHVDASETARRMVDILRPTWIYPSGPTHDSLSEWFIDSFPIRNVEQRATLDQGFRAALADVAI
ncbi:MAG: BTAD domain-containing putative transcriptional regulator [Litoreibacter sp.]